MKANYYEGVTWFYGADYSRFVYLSTRPPALIKLTRTMLEKHIIDANETVRAFALLLGVDYDKLQPGDKVTVPAEFKDGSATAVTFYRAKTRGDKRVSVKGLNGRSSAGDDLLITQRFKDDGEKVIVLTYNNPDMHAELTARLRKL